jgi:hypothetical protein
VLPSPAAAAVTCCRCRHLLYIIAVLVLVGNKTDLAEHRMVTEEEARAFADRSAPRLLLFMRLSCVSCALVMHQPCV